MNKVPSYSLSHIHTIKWSLEMELNRLVAMRKNDEGIMFFLKERIAQLKEEEKECLRIQAS